MGQFIAAEDLAPFAVIDAAKAAAMVSDSEAMAVLVAPCLSALTTVPAGETPEDQVTREAKLAAVKAILRGAILRWNEAGAGAVTQRQVGPFGQSIDTRTTRKAMFWPSEIEQLQSLCAGGDTGKAFALDVVSISDANHAPWCALLLGATYCSCGADIAGYPIFEAP
jgi:hypothetical protein